MEEWKEIEGYNNYYVSNEGRVKSIDRVIITGNGARHYTERELKPSLNEGGYYVVNLSSVGKSDLKRVHILVAEAFIPNPDKKPVVDHINTVRTDNRVENLRWLDHKGNSNNELTIGHLKESHKEQKNENLMKKVYQYSLDDELIEEFNSTKEAGEKLGISQQLISSICNGKRKQRDKYILTYTKKGVIDIL